MQICCLRGKFSYKKLLFLKLFLSYSHFFHLAIGKSYKIRSSPFSLFIKTWQKMPANPPMPPNQARFPPFFAAGQSAPAAFPARRASAFSGYCPPLNGASLPAAAAHVGATFPVDGPLSVYHIRGVSSTFLSRWGGFFPARIAPGFSPLSGALPFRLERARLLGLSRFAFPFLGA